MLIKEARHRCVVPDEHAGSGAVWKCPCGRRLYYWWNAGDYIPDYYWAPVPLRLVAVVVVFCLLLIGLLA